MGRWFVGGDHRGERGGFRQLVMLVEEVEGLPFATLVQLCELHAGVHQALVVGVTVAQGLIELLP